MVDTAVSALEYLSPILLSLVLTLGLAILTYRRQNVAGARAFGFILIFEALWILGFIFELLSPRLGEKIFWDSLQYLQTFFLPS